MKHLRLLIAFISLLIGCNNSNPDSIKNKDVQKVNKKHNIKEKIAGLWYSNDTVDIQKETVTDVGVKSKMEEYVSYKQNGLYKNYGTVKYIISNNGRQFVAKYKFSFNGKWDVFDDKLYETINVNDFQFQYLGTDASRYEDKYIIKNFNNRIIESIRDALIELNGKPITVLSLDDNKLVIKDFDDEIIQYKRLK